MPYLTMTGASIYYEMSGAREGPWVTLSHSLGGDHTLWEAFAERLGASHRVLRYDTRGHGRSVRASGGGATTLDLLAADVAALWDALGIERSHFVGLSLGGIAGLTLALKHADRLDRLVLCDCRADAGPEFQQLWELRGRKVREGGMAAVVEDTLGLWFKPPFRQAHPDLMHTMRRMICETSVEGYLECAQAVQSLRYGEKLGKIACAPLLVVGADDGPHPALMRAMADRIPNARYEEIADAAHMPNIEQSDAFHDLVANFLSQ